MPDQDQNGDHDLIPDEWQEPAGPRPDQPLAKPVAHDEHDFGQMAPAKGEPPPRKQIFEKPKKTDWTPIDVSHGMQRITGNRQSFIAHEKKDLKTSLGGILNAGQRAELSEDIANVRGRLTKEKLKRIAKNLKGKGTLNKFEAKRFLRSAKANKSSGLF